MKKPLLVLLLMLAVPGWAEDVPPGAPDDYPALEGWFGRSRLEPVWEGWLIADGRYVEAPYVVEHRGRHLYINGKGVTH